MGRQNSYGVPDVALGEKWGTGQSWGEERSKHPSSQGQTDGLKPSLYLAVKTPRTVMMPQDCHGHLMAEDLGQGAALCWPRFPLLPTASNHLSRAHALPAAAAVSPGARSLEDRCRGLVRIPQGRGKPVHSAQPSSLLFPRVGMAAEQKNKHNSKGSTDGSTRTGVPFGDIRPGLRNASG